LEPGSGVVAGITFAAGGPISGTCGFASGFGVVSAAAGGVGLASAAPYAALTSPADFTASRPAKPTMVIGNNRMRLDHVATISHRFAWSAISKSRSA
jgi:hypothetical protein